MKTKARRSKRTGSGRQAAPSKSRRKAPSGSRKPSRSGVRAKKKTSKHPPATGKRTAKASKTDKARLLKKKKAEKQLLLKAKARAKREADAEKKRLSALKEREKQQKERQRLELKKRADKERAAAEAKKKREREEAEKERKKLAALKEREKQELLKKREQEKLQKEREKEKLKAQKERDRVAAQKEKERAAQLKAQEKAREQALKEKEAAKVAAKKAREEETARKKAEREAEKIRLRTERDAERERLRDEAKKKKDEERARRDAEREAYRKAKEGEQARIRAEREAAKRALEGRVVRATRASRAAQGGRAASTTRVYQPSAIPDQSGTRRATEGDLPVSNRFANLRTQKAPPPSDTGRPIPRTIPPPPPPPPPATIEERYARINERLALTDDAFRHEYEESLLMSWIYHDSALEGVVYSYDELRMAINPNITVVPDSTLQTVCDEIRRHKAAIEFVRDQAEKKRVAITIDTVKRIYLILHPEEGDLKTVKYRKDIPQHRLYFHEYAPPDKIAYKVRQVFEWLNGPEPKKIKNAVRIAARAHYDLLRIFPFALDSGKVSRLFMNLLLMRADCPPALVHSTERQRYYEALRGSLPIINSMVNDSIMNAISSIEKKLDERDTKLRPFG